MTLLTMTATIVDAVHAYHQISEDNKQLGKINKDELSLSNPHIGDPITHKQLIALHEILKPYKTICVVSVHLDQLLHGSHLYKVPKANKTGNGTAEYQSFMASLRRNEEARKYQQMLQSTSGRNAIINESPGYLGRHVNSTLNQKGDFQYSNDEDEITFADLRRQVALIINMLVSVVACAVAIWVVSRWWDTPMRLFLSIGAGVLVAIAEVMVYGGFLRRLMEAKKKEEKMTERKDILETWILQANDQQSNDASKVIRDRNESTKRRKTGRHNTLFSTHATNSSED